MTRVTPTPVLIGTTPVGHVLKLRDLPTPVYLASSTSEQETPTRCVFDDPGIAAAWVREEAQCFNRGVRMRTNRYTLDALDDSEQVAWAIAGYKVGAIPRKS